MSNISIENVDTGSVLVRGDEYQDGLLTFAGAATIKAGTILARDSVSGKFVPFVIGGSSNENGVPKAVVTYEVIATAAGDLPVRPLVTGIVDRGRLVVNADGDASNLTDAHVDALRSYGLVAQPVAQLAGLDNQ